MGETWTTISPDLTTGDSTKQHKESGGLTYDASGAEFHTTILQIAPSPVRRGVIWVGTDDGNVQVTRDGAQSFTEVGRNIPGANHEYYVSGLEASWFDAGVAYVALDGHRHDDWRPFIFKTTDYGQSWASVAGNLPEVGQVNSIRQDPVNARLLYAATETGFFVSLNDGASWSAFMPGLPDGRVDEVLDLVDLDPKMTTRWSGLPPSGKKKA